MTFVSRRAVLWAALFLFCCAEGWSKKNTDNLETYRDQINKSQVLLLQRDRQQAIQVLVAAMNREGLKSPASTELLKALKKTSEVFLSEKAQQSYEMAIATFSTNKAQSIEKLRETLSQEPQNAVLIKALLFTLLSQKECTQAQKQRLELIKINPFDEDLDRLHLLELVCLNSRTEALAVFARQDPLVLNQTFWQVNKQRLLSGDPKLIILEPRPLEEEYPEGAYLRWLGEKDDKKRMLLAEKYKNLCHANVPFDKSYAWMDPWVCGHLKEIDDFHIKGDRGN